MKYLPLISAAYTILGIELSAVKLLDEQWNPRKVDDASSVDNELVDLFRIVERITIDSYGIKRIEAESIKINEAINKLHERDAHINNTLLAVHLIRFWAQNNMGPNAIMLASKTTRLVDKISEEVRKEAGHDIAKMTYRTADDILRFLQNRPILNNDIRDAFFSRIIRKTKENHEKSKTV